MRPSTSQLAESTTIGRSQSLPTLRPTHRSGYRIDLRLPPPPPGTMSGFTQEQNARSTRVLALLNRKSSRGGFGNGSFHTGKTEEERRAERFKKALDDLTTSMELHSGHSNESSRNNDDQKQLQKAESVDELPGASGRAPRKIKHRARMQTPTAKVEAKLDLLRNDEDLRLRHELQVEELMQLRVASGAFEARDYIAENIELMGSWTTAMLIERYQQRTDEERMRRMLALARREHAMLQRQAHLEELCGSKHAWTPHSRPLPHLASQQPLPLVLPQRPTTTTTTLGLGAGIGLGMRG